MKWASKQGFGSTAALGRSVVAAAWSCAAWRETVVAWPTAGRSPGRIAIGRSVSNFGRDFRRTNVTLAERGTFVPRPAGLCGLDDDSR
ncbi:unnamed protein product [Microthlaspi erraticum]|uniref:Uncharacterized protein n=1 Tax=Microthlaspi erraticum TaxID=1685480 RepID=A0A6D2JQD6_9BRAS|nr:unnamed protein product [Microthlaspi erraticum]